MVNLLNMAFILAQMRHNQWKSEAEIEEIQDKKLRALASYASEYSPFYRRLLEKKSIGGLEDLESLPLTRKEDLQEQPKSFVSTRYDLNELEPVDTSGFTGQPRRTYLTPSDAECRLALEYRHMVEAGVKPRDVHAHVAHYEFKPRFIQKFGLFRHYYLSMFDDETENLLKLKGLKPDILSAYPSTLASFARMNLSMDLDISLKTVFSYGEGISSSMRNTIKGSFGCSVRNIYGAAEVNWIAWECEKGSMHVNSDFMIAEIVDEHGNPMKKGEKGELALTPLWARGAPLLRYTVGDRASLGSTCSCGRGLQVLKSIEGRDYGAIKLPSGKVISATMLTLLDDLLCFRTYQIIQEKEGLFVFRFVPMKGNGPQPEDMAEVERRIKRGCLGEEVKVEFEQVDSIRKGRTGKLETVITKVRH